LFKAVIFDLGKVIVPFDMQRGYRALQPHCSFPLEELPKRVAAADIVRRFEAGQVSPEDFVRQFSAVLGLNIGYDRFCELWSSIFLPDPLVPDALLEGLRRRYRLVLLSNTNAIHFAMIRQTYPIIRHFDESVLSYEVGTAKPDPRIYQVAIERAGCRPEECFYTDDIEPFVEGGRRAGMEAVQFHSAEQIERELEARGIEWR
jgi:putative hydrolase of the HAD superfamily